MSDGFGDIRRRNKLSVTEISWRIVPSRQPRDAEPEVTVEREQDKLDYPELRRWFVR